MIRIGLKS